MNECYVRDSLCSNFGHNNTYLKTLVVSVSPLIMFDCSSILLYFKFYFFTV